MNDLLMQRNEEGASRNVPSSNQTSSNAIRKTKFANEGRSNLSKSIIVN